MATLSIPHIGIRMFHTVAIFFKQAKSTLYCCAKRLQFFVDNGIWSSWPVFTVAISKMCIRDKSTPPRIRAWKNYLSIFLTDFFSKHSVNPYKPIQKSLNMTGHTLLFWL